MTKEQKILVLHYREQHMTYRQIGEKLGLSPDTVKTFCRRKRAQSERTEESVQAQCRNCGAPVHLLPGRRERLFCSPACRTAYWRKHNLLGGTPRYCAGCGALLTGGSASRKYCSHACYIRHRFGSTASPSGESEKATHSRRLEANPTAAAANKKPTASPREEAEPTAPILTKEQFERELNYRAAFSIAKQMREDGLVTPGEFVQIDRFLRRKFSPVWGGLYQNNA